MSKLEDKLKEEYKRKLKKLNEKEFIKDVDDIINYANSLSTLDIENFDLDKMNKEIKEFDKTFKEKYEEYLSGEDLDFEE